MAAFQSKKRLNNKLKEKHSSSLIASSSSDEEEDFKIDFTDGGYTSDKEEELFPIVHYEMTSTAAYPPLRATKGSVGYDLFSPISRTLHPGESYVFRLGLKLNFPDNNHYAQIVSRSGMAFVYNIHVVGSGIIDPDYNRVIAVKLENRNQNSKSPGYKIEKGDRICQLIFFPDHRTKLVLTKPTPVKIFKSKIRNGGLGSTGK